MARQLPAVFNFERQFERRKEEERLETKRAREEKKQARKTSRQEILDRLRTISSLEANLRSRDIAVPASAPVELGKVDVLQQQTERLRQLTDVGAVPEEAQIQQDVEGELKRLGERTRTLRASKAGKEEMAKFVTGFIASNAIGKSFTIDGTRITSLDNVEEVHDFFELKAGRTAGVSYDRFDPANRELVENAVNKFLAGRPEGENELKLGEEMLEEQPKETFFVALPTEKDKGRGVFGRAFDEKTWHIMQQIKSMEDIDRVLEDRAKGVPQAQDIDMEKIMKWFEENNPRFFE